jgi:malonyl-CoA O-methyltransferase
MSVDVGPRRRLVQKVMSDCLNLIRLYGDCDEAAFARQIQGLPALLRRSADQLESPPADLEWRLEPSAFQGYALWAESYDQAEDNAVIAGEEEVIWDLIAGALQSLDVPHVLDVGCGTGRHALPLAAQGARVTCIDPTPEMLAQARDKATRAGLDIEWRQGTIEALSSDLGHFDLVLCCLVLSHVADLEGAIARLVAHVQPGGHLIVSDFHPLNILLGWRTSCSKDSHKYVVPNYLHLPADYFAAMNAAGLHVTELLEKGHTAKLPGLPMTLIIAGHKPGGCDESTGRR